MRNAKQIPGLRQTKSSKPISNVREHIHILDFGERRCTQLVVDQNKESQHRTQLHSIIGQNVDSHIFATSIASKILS